MRIRAGSRAGGEVNCARIASRNVIECPIPDDAMEPVVAAGGRAGPAAREALAELCSAYWYPLYAVVRRKGHPPDEAADLVQGTFLTCRRRRRGVVENPGRTSP
jgi:hypothetical protein